MGTFRTRTSLNHDYTTYKMSPRYIKTEATFRIRDTLSFNGFSPLKSKITFAKAFRRRREWFSVLHRLIEQEDNNPNSLKKGRKH